MQSFRFCSVEEWREKFKRRIKRSETSFPGLFGEIILHFLFALWNIITAKEKKFSFYNGNSERIIFVCLTDRLAYFFPFFFLSFWIWRYCEWCIETGILCIQLNERLKNDRQVNFFFFFLQFCNLTISIKQFRKSFSACVTSFSSIFLTILKPIKHKTFFNNFLLTSDQ